MTKRIVILVSGNGSNAQAIIDQCEQGKINGEVVAVVSNKASAFALKRAQAHHIEAVCIPHQDFVSREAFDAFLLHKVQEFRPDLVVLAGFMRILSPAFVDALSTKLLNIHPSLLPKYPGLNTHQRAIENGDTEHGSSVHFVTAELDGGPVVLQSKVAIHPHDTAQTLAQRLAQTEWQIYPRVVEWFCDGRLVFDGKHLSFDGSEVPIGGVNYGHQ
ncbi:phosphoribosylglycinamide formyltransferase [Glaciecola siphonariae]|uniref:Phosphoribosylglycinamide formyltransferase n=1 Tax=Glaciecola siphonariae TaxID=521012 RepID=A0ABV9LTY4_9ALTE